MTNVVYVPRFFNALQRIQARYLAGNTDKVTVLPVVFADRRREARRTLDIAEAQAIYDRCAEMVARVRALFDDGASP